MYIFSTNQNIYSNITSSHLLKAKILEVQKWGFAKRLACILVEMLTGKLLAYLILILLVLSSLIDVCQRLGSRAFLGFCFIANQKQDIRIFLYFIPKNLFFHTFKAVLIQMRKNLDSFKNLKKPFAYFFSNFYGFITLLGHFRSFLVCDERL